MWRWNFEVFSYKKVETTFFHSTYIYSLSSFWNNLAKFICLFSKNLDFFTTGIILPRSYNLTWVSTEQTTVFLYWWAVLDPYCSDGKLRYTTDISTWYGNSAGSFLYWQSTRLIQLGFLEHKRVNKRKFGLENCFESYRVDKLQTDMFVTPVFSCSWASKRRELMKAE